MLSALDKPSVYRTVYHLRPTILATWVKRLIRVKRRTIQTDIGTFLIDPISGFGQLLIENHNYEPEMTEVLKTYLHPHSSFIDLGANEGYHTVTASKLAARVIAVEPQGRVLNILKKNLALNNCRNVEVVPYAISDTAGEADFFLYPDTNPGASGLKRATVYKVTTEQVKTLTLATLFHLHNLDSCDLLKIDIEGAEYEAILGSKELFASRKIKTIALEPSERMSSHPTDRIIKFLIGCGYTLDSRFKATPERMIWTLTE